MYLEAGTVEEVRREAARQDRAFSWLLQQAWDLAKDTIKKSPAPETE